MILTLISFLGGFLTANIIDTSLGEFSEFAIVGASLVVANIESFNRFYYSILNNTTNILIKRSSMLRLLNLVNFYKIGIIYGLIVDAFKLGS